MFFEVDSIQSNIGRMQSNNFVYDSVTTKMLNPEELEVLANSLS